MNVHRAGRECSVPLIGLLPGDRNGIGPELVAKLLAEPRGPEAPAVVVLGEEAVLRAGEAAAGARIQAEERSLPIGDPETGKLYFHRFAPLEGAAIATGEATQEAGRESLEALALAARLARDGVLDGVVFAPLNKAAMHLGGLAHEDEMQYLGAVLEHDGPVGELNVLGDLWTGRVTSHIPLKDVAAAITPARVGEAGRLLDGALRGAGVERPRIAVAGLNPHAGDGGNFGREEIEVIGPAIEGLKDGGVEASGPWPSDTVFVRAQRGELDAVLTMYHDQGQIAMKLMGFAQGVTVLGGLPVPVTTCGHGTAYDIVGQGRAGIGSLTAALALCTRMARLRQKEQALGD